MEGDADRVGYTPPNSRHVRTLQKGVKVRRTGCQAAVNSQIQSDSSITSTYTRRNTEHLEVQCGESRVAAGAFASVPSAALKQRSSSLARDTTT